LLSRLDQKQPAGFARWNGALLAKALAVSPDRVWRELRCLGISLQRRRSWVRLHRSAVCAKSRQALRGASFRSVKELTDAIDAFIAAYNKTAAPFAWRKLNVTPKSFASK